MTQFTAGNRGTAMRRLGLALGLAAATAAVFAIALESQSAAGSSSPRTAEHDHASHRNAKQERYLYVTTLSKSADDPDFIAVIGADPHHADFGRIVTASTCRRPATSSTTSATRPTRGA